MMFNDIVPAQTISQFLDSRLALKDWPANIPAQYTEGVRGFVELIH